MLLELQTDESKEKTLYSVAAVIGVIAGLPGLLCMYKSVSMWLPVAGEAGGYPHSARGDRSWTDADIPDRSSDLFQSNPMTSKGHKKHTSSEA